MIILDLLVRLKYKGREADVAVGLLSLLPVYLLPYPAALKMPVRSTGGESHVAGDDSQAFTVNGGPCRSAIC